MSSEERPTDDSDDNETVGESAGVGESSPTVLPIRMLHDRILVDPDDEAGERRSTGILIPATVQMGRRLAWAKVLATGSSVRTVKLGDRVLSILPSVPRSSCGKTYLLLRERDVHAVAAERLRMGLPGSICELWPRLGITEKLRYSYFSRAPLAQLAEQLTLNQRVQGSSPWRCTNQSPARVPWDGASVVCGPSSREVRFPNGDKPPMTSRWPEVFRRSRCEPTLSL